MRITGVVKLIAYDVREKTLIIIPTYNERENIVDLLKQIREIVPGAHVAVVDDRSPDGTGEVVRSFSESAEGAAVTLIERSGARGLGNAYREGLRYGLDHGYDVLLTMDADFSHNPLHLPACSKPAGITMSSSAPATSATAARSTGASAGSCSAGWPTASPASS